MDQTLHDKIANKLRGYLNREPSEDEIINGQNDATLMHWIAQDDAAAQNNLITAVAQGAGLDITVLQANLASNVMIK